VSTVGRVRRIDGGITVLVQQGDREREVPASLSILLPRTVPIAVGSHVHVDMCGDGATITAIITEGKGVERKYTADGRRSGGEPR
jgi:hypothetical protein